MSGVWPQGWIDSFDPVEVRLDASEAREAVVPQSAFDSDRATVAFHEEWQSLTQERIVVDPLLRLWLDAPATLPA